MGKRVLITGGAGFLGSRLAAHLAAAGHEVTSVDQRSPLPGAAFAQEVADITDGLRLRSLLEAGDIECVVHAAAMADLDLARTNPVATVTANLVGTAQVLEAARQAGVERVVYVSSEAVYGVVPGSAAIDEARCFDPISVYGATKAGGELLLGAYRQACGLDLVSVRLAEVYGPGLTMSEYVTELVAAAVGGAPFLAGGPVDQPVGLVFVEDAVEALRLVVEAESLAQQAYHVSDGELHTFGSVAATVRRLLPGADIAFGGDPHHPRLAQPPWDLTALRRDLDFGPRWVLDDALPVLIAAARAEDGAS
ncbi:NAD-dependent epimerase/dehydratase family protein [Amycolatopsis jejuensis]|uniref:NAD-dependent epimerase/dehydratase family protein n=1 Tax=Amycolatopsis jejuensis TaxID=330084 RepID=UPI0005276996|nr:NAD(P)-dependent oxidoreductase [Amycolatopsis jejuensis]